MLDTQVLPRARAVIGLVAVLWVVGAVNLVLGGALERFGIRPREVSGLVGIPLAPFLHAGLLHLVSNTVPMLILGAMVAVRGVKSFWGCTAFVAVVGGLGVWLFGRPAYHVGASGVVFGYFGFLVAAGWFERKVVPVLLALVTIFLYSGVLWGLLPLSARVSWEGHLFGLLAGALWGWMVSRKAASGRSGT